MKRFGGLSGYAIPARAKSGGERHPAAGGTRKDSWLTAEIARALLEVDFVTRCHVVFGVSAVGISATAV